MSKKVTRDEVLTGAMCLGFVGTIIYAIDVTLKLNNVAKKLDKSVSEIVNTTGIDIPDEVIDSAVEKAVERNVSLHVKNTCKTAVNNMESDINREIKEAITLEFNRQKDSIKKQIKHQIGEIDISEVKEEVIAEAKEAAQEQFQEDLDDIVEKHNDNLESMTRIYTSIADKLENI